MRLTEAPCPDSQMRAEAIAVGAPRPSTLVIGFVNELDKEAGLIRKSPREKAVGLINKLATETGGRAFFPDKKFDLNAAFAEIEQELRTQYLIAYSSSNKKRDGAYRKITIEITNPELRQQKLELRHRPGYFAKRSAEGAGK